MAFDRLISYKSGIFGFPLRLLARENYDKAVNKLGLEKVALITGEEKILPASAKYYFCTVESMPLNIEVECVAVDEVQLAADYERGHIFTDRILNLRGEFETIFLGSSTVEKILLKLFPKINIQKRDRFSRLSYTPKNSLIKLNPRSAVITFNINSVYEIAESLKMHKGGAAVVLGSLSPRTRNSQVEVYESKKVDYLVATDAIGMGLNLNINHVSFSSLQKFDGRYTRNLSPSEIGQIAGRAGRYQNDGTFSHLKGANGLDPLIIQSVENHQFIYIEKIYWRNSNINFQSVNSVLDSFKLFPIKNFFIHKKNAEDEINFRALSKNSEVLKYLNNEINIKLLWDICRIPDFQKIFNDSYLDFLTNVFLNLVKNERRLPEQWLQEKILKLENYQGGIEELSGKISNIRTWTYIANQSSWIDRHKYWQEKTQDIEDNLSDYLHNSLTNRFVDFSASFFVYSKNQGEVPIIEVGEDKSIKLNGQNYGYISGFDLELNLPNSKSTFFLTHVKKSIRSMIDEKINNFLKAPIDSLNLGEIKSIKINELVKIYWGDEPIGKLTKGINIFSPQAEALNSEFLDSDKKILVTKKIQDWIDFKILSTLKPITKIDDKLISSEIRSIVFNVYNSLGILLNNNYLGTLKTLDESGKADISRKGIRIGAKFFFMPNLLKKSPMELNALLWKIYHSYEKDHPYPLPLDGRVSFLSKVNMPESYWSAIGYCCLGDFVIRVDVFERIFFLARKKFKYGPFIESSDLMNPLGCNSDQIKDIMLFCGFDSITLGDNKKLFFLRQKKQSKLIKKQLINKKSIYKIPKKQKPKINIINNKKVSLVKESKNILNNKKTSLIKENKADPNSPFAVLEKLL